MTKGERQVAAESNIQQLQQAVQMNQAMIRFLNNSLQNLRKDFSEIAGSQREMQYRLLAFQELNNMPLDKLNEKAQELQVKDFEEYSAKDDEENGYTVGDVVGEDSIVIFTTEAEDNQGFLRSKQLVSEIGFPEMRDSLIGKNPGDVIDVDVNGVTHKLTLLGVREKPPVEVKDEEAV
jgi:hypothetical protein